MKLKNIKNCLSLKLIVITDLFIVHQSIYRTSDYSAYISVEHYVCNTYFFLSPSYAILNPFAIIKIKVST